MRPSGPNTKGHGRAPSHTHHLLPINHTQHGPDPLHPLRFATGLHADYALQVNRRGLPQTVKSKNQIQCVNLTKLDIRRTALGMLTPGRVNLIKADMTVTVAEGMKEERKTDKTRKKE